MKKYVLCAAIIFFRTVFAEKTPVNINVADLVFFKDLSLTKDPIAELYPNSSTFHVAIVTQVVNNHGDNLKIFITDAFPGQGVRELPLQLRIDSMNKQVGVVFARVKGISIQQRRRAVLFALKKIGRPYNDLFLENRINSKGEKDSFYCSQLVVFAFPGVFPLVPLRFGQEIPGELDKNEPMLDFWKSYYQARGRRQTPIGELGSHPSQLMQLTDTL